MSDSPPELEDFALKGLHLAKMTGVSTAVHAIPDGFMLMHTGVGCKYKAAAQVARHDWSRHPNRREAWTQIGEMSLIQGAGARIGPFARSWYERRRPELMIVVSAYFIELTGDDIKDMVIEAERTLPCDMISVATAAPNKGFFEGYAEVNFQILKRQDWRSRPTRARTASVLGFFFHRYEPDQLADMGQLKQLLKVCGVAMGPVLLSGMPYTRLREAYTTDTIVQLPYARPVAKKLRRLLKRRNVVTADLPIGLSGTSRWLREVTQAVDGNMEVTNAWIDRQLERVRPLIGYVANNFHGLEVALFADTPLAAGLASFLRELGVELCVVGLRDTALGGSAAFRQSLAADGQELNEGCEVWERPSLDRIRAFALRRLAEGRLHLVMGSSIELDVFAHLPREIEGRHRLALMEIGFPTVNHHATTPQPTLGYSGALVWAQRILQSVLNPGVGSAPS